MYLLDTNVLSELRKVGDGRADPHVTAWTGRIAPGDLHISVMSIMEIELGILRIERRDRLQGDRLRTWMRHHLQPAFTNRTLPITPPIALQCARLRVPDPASERDAWIGATALVHGLTLVTRNVSHFSRTGLSIINPWEPVP